MHRDDFLLSDRCREAYEFAARAHNGHVRKGSNAPYIVHPVAVARVLQEVGVEDAAMLRAALLHDVVENTGRTLDEIDTRFGPDVAGLVGELTRPEETKENRSAFAEYLDGLSPRARLIKLADRIENIRGLADIPDDPEFVRRYMEETRELFIAQWTDQTHAGMARMLRVAYEQVESGKRPM